MNHNLLPDTEPGEKIHNENDDEEDDQRVIRSSNVGWGF